MHKSLAVVALLTLAGLAHADVIVRWNYNSPSPDGNVGSGTQNASTGTGLTATVGTTGSFATGGGTDATASDNSGFSVTTFPTQGTGSGTRGVQFNGSTAGFWNIGFTWDQRLSPTASRYGQVQYTTNGSTWTNAGSAVDFTLANGAFSSYAASGIGNAAGNNSAFAVRIVAVFAPSTSAYAGVSSAYAAAGTWRFDMPTITGTANSAPTGGSGGGNLTAGDAPVVIDLSTLWGDVDTTWGDIVQLVGGNGDAGFSLNGNLLTFVAPASVAGTQTFTFNYTVRDAGNATGAGTVSFVVTPTPGSAALFGLGALAAARRRRV